MCRLMITIAVGLVALGAGLLFATVFPACFLIVLISLVMIGIGICLFNRNTR